MTILAKLQSALESRPKIYTKCTKLFNTDKKLWPKTPLSEADDDSPTCQTTVTYSQKMLRRTCSKLDFVCLKCHWFILGSLHEYRYRTIRLLSALIAISSVGIPSSLTLCIHNSTFAEQKCAHFEFLFCPHRWSKKKCIHFHPPALGCI